MRTCCVPQASFSPSCWGAETEQSPYHRNHGHSPVVWTSHLFVLVSASACCCWYWGEKLSVLLLCSFFLTVLYYYCWGGWIGRRAGAVVLRLESSQNSCFTKKPPPVIIILANQEWQAAEAYWFIFMSRNWLQEIRDILANLTWVLGSYKDLLQPFQGSVNSTWCRLPFHTQFWVPKMFVSFLTAPLRPTLHSLCSDTSRLLGWISSMLWIGCCIRLCQ